MSPIGRRLAALTLVGFAITASVTASSGTAPARGPAARSAAVPAIRDVRVDFDQLTGVPAGGGSYIESHIVTSPPAPPVSAVPGGFTAEVQALRYGGYVVAVTPSAPGALASAAGVVVTQLRALGVPLSTTRSDQQGVGRIVIVQRSACSGQLLGVTTRTQGAVWSVSRSWVTTSLQAVVSICTSTVGRGGTLLLGTLQHEMGHALGLGHFNTTYLGQYQIMAAILRAGTVGYRAGDTAGIRHLAAGVVRPGR